MLSRRSAIIVLAVLLAAVIIPVAPTAFAEGTDYVVTVDCLHANYKLNKHLHKEGDIVTVTFYSVDEGYSIDHILTSAGDEIIPNQLVGDTVSFVMPAKDVAVKVTFYDASLESESQRVLSTKEIIAIAITGVLVLSAIGYFVFTMVRRRKN